RYRIVADDVVSECTEYSQIISVFARHATTGMRDLDPGGTRAGQDISNEEFGVGSIKLAAPEMNHHGETLGSSSPNHLGNPVAFVGIAYLHGGRGEVHL